MANAYELLTTVWAAAIKRIIGTFMHELPPQQSNMPVKNLCSNIRALYALYISCRKNLLSIAPYISSL